MSIAGWLVAIGVFVLFLTIAVIIAWWLKNKSKPSVSTPTVENLPLGWSTPTIGPSTDKNICQVYQFPVQELNGKYLMANPTLNTKILNGMRGNTTISDCIDEDQLIAQQVQHQCSVIAGKTDKQTDRCILQTGGTTGIGGIEIFYTNASYSSKTGVGCHIPQNCAGQLSLVAVGYQIPTITPPMCITSHGENQPITMETCDPTNPNQLFRVTRTNIGEDPSMLKMGQGQNGFLTKIYDRNSGKCIVPTNNRKGDIWNIEYTNYPGCTLDTSNIMNVIYGNEVVLGDCKGGMYPGYVWGTIPSLSTCRGSGCNPLTTPPQIVRLDNIDLKSMPKTYQGYTGTEALFWWSVDNANGGLESMFNVGTGGSKLITTVLPYQNLQYCETNLSNSQYLTLSIYNTMIEQQVCYAKTGNQGGCYNI